MKQNITVEQLKELNDKQLKNLYNLRHCPYLIRIAYTEKYHFQVTDEDYSEASYHINIGAMIEILIDNVPKTDYIEDSIDIEYDRVTNTVLVEYRKGNYSFGTFENKELCDALWEAVKSILD